MKAQQTHVTDFDQWSCRRGHRNHYGTVRCATCGRVSTRMVRASIRRGNTFRATKMRHVHAMRLAVGAAVANVVASAWAVTMVRAGRIEPDAAVMTALASGFVVCTVLSALYWRPGRSDRAVNATLVFSALAGALAVFVTRRLTGG
jgi:hypothetical protein